MDQRVPAAVMLGGVCLLLAFVGELLGPIGEGVALAGAVVAVGGGFFLSQYFLSRGRSLKQSLPILAALNFLPLCLGILAVVAEWKSGAWIQGVVLVSLGLTCSLSGAALAARTGERLKAR